MGRFIGVDLHKNMFLTSTYDAENMHHQVRSYRLQEMQLFISALLPDDIVGVESIKPVPNEAVIDDVLINVPWPEAIEIVEPDVSNNCFTT